MKKLLIYVLLISVFLGLVACGETPPLETGDLVISFLSVGKADAILMKTESTSILIDTGYNTSVNIIADAMKKEGIEKLDYMILTHFDKDHIGSAPAILNNYPVGQVYMPAPPVVSDEYTALMNTLEHIDVAYTRLTEDVEISLSDGATLRLNPSRFIDEDENNHSIIAALNWGEFGCLFLADALKDRLEEYRDIDTSNYEVVKLPHHGDYYKKLEEYLREITPSYAIVCDGEEREMEENIFTMCNDLGINLMRTGEGTIRLIYQKTDGTYRLVQS
jgi:beta-lactamase superfamily II metal-dependent hydrolase